MSDKKLQLDSEQWKTRLTPDQYRIAREHGTERAFSPGNFHDNKAKGDYTCIGCGTVLWRWSEKFDSGTGWPSFFAPASPDCIATSDDFKFFQRRTEVHCAICESHMGHVFQDGPQPTGLRYCINGAVLEFHPEDSA